MQIYKATLFITIYLYGQVVLFNIIIISVLYSDGVDNVPPFILVFRSRLIRVLRFIGTHLLSSITSVSIIRIMNQSIVLTSLGVSPRTQNPIIVVQLLRAVIFNDI